MTVQWRVVDKPEFPRERIWRECHSLDEEALKDQDAQVTAQIREI